MDGVGEVDHCGSAGKHHCFALRCEDVHFGGEEVTLQELYELLRVAPLSLLGLKGLAHPHQLRVQAVCLHALGLVEPVRRDTVLGEVVHLIGPYLDLQRRAEGHDRCVQGLVHIALRRGDVVVELSRDGDPQGMNDAQHGITGGHVIHEDPDRQDVVQLVHGELFALHLLIDAVVMLGPALDPAGDALLPQA